MASNLTKAVLNGKLMFPSDFVAAIEFGGRDVTLTIKGVSIEDLQMAKGKKERKPVLTFEKTRKKLILNKTNASSIADLHGTQAEQWVGKQITLYPTRTQCGRDVVDCIRVRDNGARHPTADVPFPEPEAHEEERDEVFGQEPGNGQHDTQQVAAPEQSVNEAAPAGEEEATPQEIWEAFKTECMDALKAAGLTVSQRSAAWAREMVAKGVKGKEWTYPVDERGALYESCVNGTGNFMKP